MSDADHPDATIDVAHLLQIERICDGFEDRIACGQPVEITQVLRSAPAQLHPQLRLCLEQIRRDADKTPQVSGLCPRDSSADHHDGAPPSIGSDQVVDGYRLERCLGRGGTAQVWQATQMHSGRLVAIKIFDHADQAADQRWRREAETVARLHHPQIVGVIGTGKWHQFPYLVSDYVDAVSLTTHLQLNAPTPRQAATLISEIAGIIDYAHQAGVIHRDLKPHNVLVDRDGKLHLTDFGLAKELTCGVKSLTQTGEILGTPAYMAPEQAAGHGKEASPQSDLYSLGVMLFRMLTGDVPFRGHPQSVVYQILNVDPPSPSSLQPLVPGGLAAICLKCLEKQPSDRFSSAAELRSELGRFLNDQPLRLRPRSLRLQVASVDWPQSKICRHAVCLLRDVDHHLRGVGIGRRFAAESLAT